MNQARRRRTRPLMIAALAIALATDIGATTFDEWRAGALQIEDVDVSTARATETAAKNGKGCPKNGTAWV